MVKLYDITEPIFTTPQDLPKPPVKEEFVNYDPKVEPPKWNWSRIRLGTPPPPEIPDRPLRGGTPDSDDKPDWRGVIKNNVIPLEAEKSYDFGQPEYRKYYFFDTPDYADPFKKLWYSFKFFAKSGALIACSVAIMRNLPPNMQTYKHLLQRWYGPWLIGGMTCSATTVTVANLRGKKDDYWNYAGGGFMAACANCRGCWIRHMNYTVYWVTAAIAIKYINEQNLVLYPTFNQGIRHLNLQGSSAENGISSGNLGHMKDTHGNPGRDSRKHAY